jgi:predicted dehydrogenase
MLTDFCCHIVDLVHWAMDVDAPKSITASGGRYALRDNGETPDTLEVVYEYETRDGKPFLMVWSHTDACGHGLEDMGLGIAFQGTEGTIVANYNEFKYIPEKKGSPLPEIPRFIPRSPGHHREWLDAIKSRGQTTCHFAYGHRLTSVGCLGNIALWTGQKLLWDAQTEKITNVAEANSLLGRPHYRAPWSLPAV